MTIGAQSARLYVALAFAANLSAVAAVVQSRSHMTLAAPIAHLALDLFAYAVVPGLTLCLLLLTTGSERALPRLRFRTAPAVFIKAATASFLAGVVTYYVLGVFRVFLRGAIGEPMPSWDVGKLLEAFPSLELAYLYVAVTAAVSEEFVYRYLPLAYVSLLPLPEHQRWRVYLFLSSVVFGSIHFELGLSAVITAGLYGALLGSIFWAYRNLTTVVIVHFTVNYISFGQVYFLPTLP